MSMLGTRRRLSREYMDDPRATRAELSESLRFIRRVNRHLGGSSVAVSALERWFKQESPADPGLPVAAATRQTRLHSKIRIIDVGTGSADIPVAMIRWAARRDLQVHVTAVDLHPVTLDLAREHAQAELGDHADDQIEFVQADALRLMDRYQPESFDIAHAGMFLHHLSDIQVMTVLRIMERLVRAGGLLIWNDLVRLPCPRLLLWPLLIGVPAQVKHDAVVSVEAGFSRREAIDLARRAGWRRVRYRRRFIHRFVLTSVR